MHYIKIDNQASSFTFPANGIRKGSVQNIPRRASAIRDVLTAIDSSIGSSGGITDVIIREQLKNSLYLLLVGSSIPYITTILIIFIFFFIGNREILYIIRKE